MKIFVMAGIFPPDIGGPANYIPKLGAALTQKGHQVSVLCFSDSQQSEMDRQFPFPVFRILRRQNLLKRELQTLRVGWRLAHGCDVIYSNGNDFKSLLLGLLTCKPRVHKIVGDTAWERAQNRKWFLGTLDEYQVAAKPAFLRVLDWIRAFPLRQSTKVITPSNYLKQMVEGWSVAPAKVEMIYNSFQPLPSDRPSLHFPALEKKNLQWMCTICRLVPWKGVETLIRSLTHNPNLGLIIVGDGPLESELMQLAQDLKLNERVIFAGRQRRQNIRFFLDQSHFFILNSSYEGLPHVVLEAMSCRKLVLASNAGGTPELVQPGKTGLLFKYNNMPTIQDAIHSALTSRHEEILNQAQHLIDHHFSFSRMIDETEKVLQLACTRK